MSYSYTAANSVYPGSSGTNTTGGGFFSNLLSGVPSNVVGAGIGAGASLLGAGIGAVANNAAAGTAADANLQATQMVLDANQKARDEYRAAADRGIGDISQGVSDYATTVNPLLTPAPITIPTYRDLTPQQQTGEKDLLRNADATLAASGLRGAGRAGVGAVMDQDRRYQEDVRAQNDADTRGALRSAQTVANSARTGLAGVEAAAGGSKANTELLTGNQLGSSLASGGQTAANLTVNTGQNNANATTANANLAGGALGSVAGAFASPYTLGAGTPNAPGLGGGSNTSYVDDGNFTT